jgi:hypothetical protein
MEMDRFNAYSDALNVLLQAEAGRPKRKLNRPEGRQTVAEQAARALDDAFAQTRARGSV